MKVTPTAIPEVLIIEPKVFGDARGFFFESFNQKAFNEATRGDKVILLTENQSTYIPLGELHRLKNPGSIPLEIIEVQSGSYLGEDDIVRFEDTYGRTKPS